MGSYTQFEDDASRLPVGMSRIGYDADTERYTFQDENGMLYESEPGNAYGMLRPVIPDASDVRRVRPNAFDSPRSRTASAADSKLSSFGEFLPSEAITSSSPDQNGSSSPDSRFTNVLLKVKSVKSAVTRLQPPKTEERVRRHSKSFSLLSFRRSQSPPTMPWKSKRGRAFSEAQKEAGYESSAEMRTEVFQSDMPTGGFGTLPPATWSSPKPSIPMSWLPSTPASQSKGLLPPQGSQLSNAFEKPVVAPVRAT